jgi:GWxTD domain-containing protein
VTTGNCAGLKLNGKELTTDELIILGMKKNIAIRTSFFLLPFILPAMLLHSCRTTKQAFDSKDLSYLYNPTKTSIAPRYNIYNQSDELSVLSVKFFAKDLFFSEANPQGVPAAQMMINIRLYNTSQGRHLVDTAAYNLTIVKEKERPEYIYDIPLKVEKGNDYTAELRIMDRLRLLVVQAFVPFNTMSYYNRYNFKVLGHFDKNELFNPILKVNEYVNLLYSRGHIDSLFISYYKPFEEVPDPPSMILPEKMLNYEPEKVVALAYSDTLPMMFPREGIYHCTLGRDIKEGFTFMNMGSIFPAMNSPQVMMEPLAYLASADELDSLRSSVKPKMALDDFWIKCGGNVEKARELIRIYYTRVLYSNFYFTSYKEGWRSERGMIYIIYGPPDKVYKTIDGENWGYRKPVIKSSWGGSYSVKEDYLFFNFKKRDELYSDNDYYISRNETLVTYWDKAVGSWRKGIVFRLDNPEGF